jgi:hypothetical protein
MQSPGWIKLWCAVFFMLTIGSFYYIVEKWWPIGKIKYALVCTTVIALLLAGINIYFEFSKNPNKTMASGWSESFTFSNAGQVWFTERIVPAGEKLVIEVKFNPVKQKHGDGTEEILKPGKYNPQIKIPGKPLFIAISDKPASVSVKGG